MALNSKLAIVDRKKCYLEISQPKHALFLPRQLTSILHYLLKRTNVEIASFRSNAVPKDTQKHIIWQLPTHYTTAYRRCSTYRCPPWCEHTPTELHVITPFADGKVDNAVLKSSPYVNQSLAHVLHRRWRMTLAINGLGSGLLEAIAVIEK